MDASVFFYVAVGVILLLIIVFASLATSISKKKKIKQEMNKKKGLPAETITPQSSVLFDEDFTDFIKQYEVGDVHDDVMRADKVASIMMRPVKSNIRPPKKSKLERENVKLPQEKQSNFNHDHIYNEDVSRRLGSIIIYRDVDGLFRFKLLTSSRETIAHSKAYTTKYACKKGIKLAVIAAKYAEVVDSLENGYVQMLRIYAFELYRDRQDKFRFKLLSNTLQDIIISTKYSRKENCIMGIKSVRSVLEFHTIKDLTKQPNAVDYEAEVRAFFEDRDEKVEMSGEFTAISQ